MENLEKDRTQIIHNYMCSINDSLNDIYDAVEGLYDNLDRLESNLKLMMEKLNER